MNPGLKEEDEVEARLLIYRRDGRGFLNAGDKAKVFRVHNEKDYQIVDLLPENGLMIGGIVCHDEGLIRKTNGGAELDSLA